MALPINNAPVYNLIIPSTEKPIKFRPFLIKEEKALLIAQQSEDPKVMMDTLKSVVKGCIQDDVNVEEFATFDIEYVFTQIRAKSVGEIVELNLLCDTCTDEKAVAPVKIDLTQVQVEKDSNHTNKIELFNDVGISMKYPSFETIKKFETLDTNNVEQMFDIVIDCIDYIYTSTEVYHSKEQTKQDMVEFLNNLSSDQFMKIQAFFETMPKLKKSITYNCPVCNKEHNKVLEGIVSFF